MKNLPEKKKLGRPSSYTPELGERICDLIATHPWGLERLCEEYPELPSHVTIWHWKRKNEHFFRLYARAKAHQADVLVEDCLNLCDKKNSDWMQVRTQIDLRKWIASKLLPKLYGDRIALEQKTDENDELKQQMLALRAELDAKNKRDY